MAKKGETRPWRIRYVWEGGIHGTMTRATLPACASVVETLCGNSDRRGVPITITVQHRDAHEPRTHFTHLPVRQED